MSNAAKKRRKVPGRIIAAYIIVAVLGFVMLYPLFYCLLGSVSTTDEFTLAKLIPIPRQPFKEISNYLLIFRGDTGLALTRAVILTVIRIAVMFTITTFISVLGGYVYSKVEFTGKRVMFLILMSSMMIPGAALIVPGFVWMARFPLVGGNNIMGLGGRGFIENPAVCYCNELPRT